MRRLLVLLVLTLAGALLGTSVAHAQATVAGTSISGPLTATPAVAAVTPSNIQQCLNGGWQVLVHDDGSPFPNQGVCVSYLGRGGTLGCPAPQVGPGPLAGAQSLGAGRLDVTGTGLTTWAAYYYLELTLDGCGTVRFYNFETAGRAILGGQLGQACPSIGVFWRDETINLSCYLIAGRTVSAVTIYDPIGTPVGYLKVAVSVPAMPIFSLGSPAESAPQRLTVPVVSGNAEQISALQLHYVANAPGYAACGSGGEGYFPYFAPTDPNANPFHPIEVVAWSGEAITLDFSSLRESEPYPGGFTLCGVTTFWGQYVAAGTVFPASTFTFYG
jgi:hypothetical protein